MRTRSRSQLAWPPTCAAGLARRLARGGHRMGRRPLVEDLRREVRSAGPGDRADLRIEAHLGKALGIAQRLEYPSTAAEVGEIDVADQAVRERQPQPVVAEHPDASHLI